MASVFNLARSRSRRLPMPLTFRQVNWAADRMSINRVTRGVWNVGKTQLFLDIWPPFPIHQAAADGNVMRSS